MIIHGLTCRKLVGAINPFCLKPLKQLSIAIIVGAPGRATKAIFSYYFSESNLLKSQYVFTSFERHRLFVSFAPQRELNDISANDTCRMACRGYARHLHIYSPLCKQLKNSSGDEHHEILQTLL